MVWLGSKERMNHEHDTKVPTIDVKVDKDTRKSIKIDTNSDHHKDGHRSNVDLIVKTSPSSHERHHHCCNDHVMRIFGHRRGDSSFRYSDESDESRSIEVPDISSSAEVEYSGNYDSSSSSVQRLIDDMSYDELGNVGASQETSASTLHRNRELASWLYNNQFWRTAKHIET